MADFDFDFPDNFLSELLETDFDELAEDMLTEAAPIYKDAIKKFMKSTILHEGESERVESVTARKPKKCKNGAWMVHIGPSGNSKNMYTVKNGKGQRTARRYPVSNILKAIWKEYGISGRQAPRPWLQRAKNDADAKIMNRMQEIYNRKVGAE